MTKVVIKIILHDDAKWRLWFKNASALARDASSLVEQITFVSAAPIVP